MTVGHTEKTNSSLRVGVSWSEGIVRLHDEDLFAKGLGDRSALFLRHVFALSEVAYVEMDRELASASIHYDASRLGLPEFLQRLAAAFRGELSALSLTPSRFFSRDLACSASRLRIQRFGSSLTTWDIVLDRPGRLRLRHPSIREDASLAKRLEDALEPVSGVLECAVWSVTGSVLIRFDPELIDAAYLLRVLDQARHAPPTSDDVSPPPAPARFGLANSSLALAIAGEMAAPVLLPACAVLLVGSNLRTFREAGRQLLRGQFGMPVLYTSIVAATLASGQFVASAAMSWMLTFWMRRYQNDLAGARRRLVGQIIKHPRYVRLATPDGGRVNVEVPIEDLKPNDLVLVSAGELIPTDGRVVDGRGLVDERMVLGLEGLSRKQPDDLVYAGSTLKLGELLVEVMRHGSQTQLATLASITLAATSAPRGSRTPTLRGETFAERTVAPTMAIAGIGLLVGDVSTAGAILRPDYATGPGIAFPLETLQAIALCLRHGILIRRPEALEQLATADILILEYHSALERTDLEVDTIQVFPGHQEEDVLRYSATAFHDLDDERAGALRTACRSRMIALLDLEPTEFATDLTLSQGKNRIKVGDLGTRARSSVNAKSADAGSRLATRPDAPDSLMVGINGQVAGLIHFRRSSKLEATAALRRLCSKRNLPVGIISEQAQPNLASLGAEFQIGGLSPDDRIQFLKDCRGRGFKVAYVGDCRVDPRTVAEVHVAISVGSGEPNHLDDDLAPIRLLQPRMTKLGELWDIASIHRRRLRVAHGYALIPNVACIAGAFVWGFTSLASVVVTNLGTYCVYSRTAASIRSLERHIAESLNTRRASAKTPIARAVSQRQIGG
jgi:cation transport ATPase